MNTPCDLIRDLIPLYHDEVCSEDSRALVEEHVADCAYCKGYLDGFRAGPIEDAPEEQEELKDLQILWKKWKRKKLKIFWKRALIIVLLLAVLSSPIWLTLRVNQPVAGEYLKVSDVCITSEGVLLFHLYVDDGNTLEQITWETGEDGSFYFVPMHPILKAKRSTDNDLSSIYMRISLPEELPTPHQPYYFWVEGAVPAVYVGSPEDPVLVWKRGQELPAASPAMERLSIEWPMYPQTAKGHEFDWETYNEMVKAILGDEMFEKGDLS